MTRLIVPDELRDRVGAFVAEQGLSWELVGEGHCRPPYRLERG